MIPTNHPSNYHLFLLAVERQLTIKEESEGVYLVSSHSIANHWHRVLVSENGYSCTCWSKTACTHGALALYKHVPYFWLDHFYQRLAARLNGNVPEIRKVAA